MKMKPKPSSEAIIEFQEASLRLGGRIDVYRQLLSMFLEACAGIVEAIGDHLDRNEFDTAGRMVHTVKGMAGQVGAMSLYGRAARLEKSIAVKSDDIMEMLSFFQSDMDQATEAVQSYLCSTHNG